MEKGQAPRGVKRVDNPDAQYGEPHIHFDDGTSITQSGKVHDAGNNKLFKGGFSHSSCKRKCDILREYALKNLSSLL